VRSQRSDSEDDICDAIDEFEIIDETEYDQNELDEANDSKRELWITSVSLCTLKSKLAGDS